VLSRKTEKQISLEKARLERLDLAIQRMVIRRSIEKLKGDTRRLTFGHWGEVEDLILTRPVGSVVDLPGGVSIAKRPSFYTVSIP